MSTARCLPIAATLLLACAGSHGIMDPDGDLHERYLFRSPVQVVMFVYQNLEAERYDDIQHAFLNRADRLPWISWEEKGDPHPWSRDPQTLARVIAIHELPDGEVAINVHETWSGGEHRRAFRCRRTPDGWRISDVGGVPGSGTLTP